MPAQDRVRLYREDGRARWERLAADMVASGEVQPEQLDFSPQSLLAVWRWVAARARKRPDGERVDPAVQPPWWSGPGWRRYAGWDDTTQDRAGAVAHYLAEVLARLPGAERGVGESGTQDAGEPVVAVPGRAVEVNPLAQVRRALADVWDGRLDEEALVRLAEPTAPLEPALLYPTRLVVRLRPPKAGLLRGPRPVPPEPVRDWLSGLVARPVALPTDGEMEVEHLGAGDWRALVDVRSVDGGVRDVRLTVGADREQPGGPGRAAEVRAALQGLLHVADSVGAAVLIEEARPDDLHASRPTGELTPERLAGVLRAVDLA